MYGNTVNQQCLLLALVWTPEALRRLAGGANHRARMENAASPGRGDGMAPRNLPPAQEFSSLAIAQRLNGTYIFDALVHGRRLVSQVKKKCRE